jgi:predicted DNA-binding transcriptional regulator AlpA
MNEQEAELPSEGFLRLPSVLKVFPVGRSTWWAGVKTGRFPKPVKLGIKTTAWRVEDIRALIARSERSLLASTYVDRIKQRGDSAEEGTLARSPASRSR